MKSRNYFFVIAVVLFFAFRISGQTEQNCLRSSQVLTVSDESAINTAVSQFFAAYASKDLAAWKTVWTVRSPVYNGSEEEIKFVFNRADRLSTRVLNLEKPVMHGDSALVNVDVESDGVSKIEGRSKCGLRLCRRHGSRLLLRP